MSRWQAIAEWWTAKRRHEDAIAQVIEQINDERHGRIAGDKLCLESHHEIAKQARELAERIDGLRASVTRCIQDIDTLRATVLKGGKRPRPEGRGIRDEMPRKKKAKAKKKVTA